MTPVSVQKGFIGLTINGLLVQVLLWGIYTVVYVGTVYIYLSKKSSRRWVIIGAISLSYAGYSTVAIVPWYLTQDQLINDSKTRQSIYEAFRFSAAWVTLVNDIIVFIMSALADGILIWRCYVVWDRSLRAIVLPSFLLVCEVAIDLSLVILQCKEHFYQTFAQALVFNHLLASQGFITFATTVSTTFLIAFRIYRVQAMGVIGNSSQLYKQVVDILLQSAALYSVAALIFASSAVIPETDANAVWLNNIWEYSCVLFLFAMGISPTLIVARVAFLDEADKNPSVVSAQVSGLRFNVRSTIHDGLRLSRFSTYKDIEIEEKHAVDIDELNAKKKGVY